MKKSKRGLLILALVISFFLISFASAAELNYALPANSGVSSFESYGTGITNVLSNPSLVNDGNEATLVGLSGSNIGYISEVGYKVKLGFSSPKNLSKIEYAKNAQFDTSCSAYYPLTDLRVENVYIYQCGMWNLISSKVSSNGLSTETISGNWTNVENISLEVRFLGDYGDYEISCTPNKHYTSELRAIGKSEEQTSLKTCFSVNDDQKNLALSSKGSIAKFECSGDDSATKCFPAATFPAEPDASNLNDGNFESYVGKEYGRRDGYSSYLAGNITFASPVDLKAIIYKRYIMNGGSSSGRVAYEKVYIYNSTGKYEVYKKDWNGLSFENTQIVNIPVNLSEVSKIEVDLSASVGGHTSGNSLKLYEIMAFGDYCECSSGQNSCNGNKYLTCNDGCSWTDNGLQDGQCNVNSCPPEDIIMKLNSSGGAHGALWNDSSYNYNICYSEIFGSAFSGDDPHNCTPDNKILGLSKENDSLAEIPSLNNYPINFNICYGNLTCESESTTVSGALPFYRFWNSLNGDHFYTASESEKNKLIGSSYILEGVEGYIFNNAVSGTTPLYRLLSNETGDHFYTTSESEKTKLLTLSAYTDEGTAGYVYNLSVSGTLPLYRLWNSLIGDHFYTTSESEKNKSVSAGYTFERVEAYVLDSRGDACSNGGKVVARLIQNTGSEIDSNLATGYPIKVCCEITYAPTMTGAKWENMINQQINITNLSDSVRLVLDGTGFSGKNVAFTIKKSSDSGVFFGPITIKAQFSNSANIVWAAGNKGRGIYEPGLFYFEAEIGGVTYSSKDNADPNYKYIEVTPDKQNDPSTANILTPLEKSIYFTGEPIHFTAAVLDPDSKITYTWIFGDGNVTKLPGDDPSLLDFYYTYSTPGQKNIVLIVEDENGVTATDKSSILIIGNSTDFPGGIFAFIKSPENGQTIDTRNVSLNATGSYFINVTFTAPSTYSIACLGGICPDKTTGCPGDNPSYGSCEIPIIGTPTYSSMNFSWKFSDDGWVTQLESYPKVGFLNANEDGIAFLRAFIEGKHDVKLTAVSSEDSSIFGEYSVVFYTEIDGECLNDGHIWQDKYGNNFDTVETTACESYAGASDCCPPGYLCQGTVGNKRCQENETINFCSEVDYCSKYSSLSVVPDKANNCNADPCKAWKNEWKIKDSSNPNYPSCGSEKDVSGITYITNCQKSCYWDDAETDVNKKCKFERTFSKIYPPNPSNIDEGSYSCIRKNLDTVESDDFYVLSWTEDKVQNSSGATITLDATNKADYPLCTSGSVKVKKTVTMPFFTFASFILSIFIIFAIYVLKSKHKK